MNAVYIVIGVAVLLLIALVIVYLVQRKKKKAREAAGIEEPSAPGGDEISLLFKEAENKLAAAKLEEGAKIANLPVFLVLGLSGTTKTSVLLNSGLDAELLAGQAYQDNAVVPTRTANLWFARRSIFAEAGGTLPADSGKWHKLIRRLAPRGWGVGKGRQAPRAAIVCFDSENFTRQGALEGAVATARNLRARLGEISQSLGINLPVYVLFTKMDRLPFFTEYVRNFSNEEAGQIVGATLPMLRSRSEGVYAEEESTRLGNHFEWLFRSLAGARPEFLSRETDPTKLPACYEFPREFRKVRQAAVQFLVDLCRPSQLAAGPFLRGFYFTGVRPVIINEAAPVAPAAAESAPGGYGAASGATSIFQVGARAAQQQQYAAPPVTSSRKVPQWVFLGQFFNQVLLADRAAMGASGSSTKTSLARRILLIAASLLCLIATTGFTVSFFKNRGLEAQVRQAAQGIPATESVTGDLASVESLRKLDTLRQAIQRLITFRTHTPWSYRWGLYVGNELYPEARRVYFDRFKQLLFGQTQNVILSSLQSLPVTPGPDYNPTYDALKAYLITTSFHEKSTAGFLTPVLMKWWMNGRGVDPDRQQLAQKQFDFYAEELKANNPYSKDSEMGGVGKARHYLAQFGSEKRVYAAMLAEAGKNPPIDFNRQFPGSATVVLEAHVVPGQFSKSGYGVMKDALQHPDRFYKGEQWVLGDQGATAITAAQLDQLRAWYAADFLKDWRLYMKSASVVRYTGLKDASDKLTQLSGNQSPLLELMSLASQNTAVEDTALALPFQPVQTVVPPANSDRYIAPSNQNYMNALVALQTSLEQIAGQPGVPSDAAAAPSLASAQQAILNTRQMAQAFRIDPDGHVETVTQRLLEDPITYAQGLIRRFGPDELNAKGKEMCGQMKGLMSKYPFNPSATPFATVPEINGVFKPQGGLLWKFVDENLQKAVTRQGSQFAPAGAAGMTINPAFLAFLNRAAAFSDAGYEGGSADVHFSYTVKPILTSDIDTVHLVIDGQANDFNATNAAAKKYTWPGSGQGVQMTLKLKSGSTIAYPAYDGLWGIFQFVAGGKRQGNLVEEPLVDPRGRPALNAANNQPITVTFEITAVPPIFDRGYFAMGCVPEVAKP